MCQVAWIQFIIASYSVYYTNIIYCIVKSVRLYILIYNVLCSDYCRIDGKHALKDVYYIYIYQTMC